MDIIKMIDTDLAYQEKLYDTATTRYARGEIDGAISALRHLRFEVRAKEIAENDFPRSNKNIGRFTQD